jgi:hypothetical protein
MRRKSSSPPWTRSRSVDDVEFQLVGVPGDLRSRRSFGFHPISQLEQIEQLGLGLGAFRGEHHHFDRQAFFGGHRFWVYRLSRGVQVLHQEVSVSVDGVSTVHLHVVSDVQGCHLLHELRKPGRLGRERLYSETMSESLKVYATRLAQRPKDALVDVPVLVWAITESRTDDLITVTTISVVPPQLGTGEPVVFPLRKRDATAANPFTMGITVGRTENNDVLLEHSSVSRFHAYFQRDGKGQWLLVDAESKNGTWAGPLKLAPNKAEAIADRTLLKFGDLTLQFLLPASFQQYVAGLGSKTQGSKR